MLQHDPLEIEKSMEIIKLLYEKHAKLYEENSDGETPLLMATRLNKINIVKYLLDNGEEVDSSNSRCETALMIAASENNLDMVKLLLAYGASVDATDGKENTALHRVIASKKTIINSPVYRQTEN